MDVVDSVFYEDTEMPEALIGAYQFFNSEDGKIVLKDMLVQCSWGSQDPTIMDEQDAKAILATQRMMWRIKAALNAKPITNQGEVDE